MQSEVREISPVLVELKVEVPWETIEKDLNDTYRHIARTAKVRGFRPGKVPQGVVRQMYGPQVKAQVTTSMVEQGLMHALQEHHLHIVAQPEVQDPPKIAKGQPMTFTAKVEVRPRVDEVDIEGLEAWQRAAVADNKLIDDEIERLRRQHANIQVPDPPRAAKAEDLVTFDYVVKVDGEVVEELGAKGRQVALDDDDLMSELKEGLQGMKPGDQKVIDVAFADTHSHEKLKGKTARFEVSISEVHEKLLPDVDDEFAKDCGDYETLLELRLKIRETIETALKQEIEAEVQEQLIDSLIEKNNIVVPPTMVNEQHQQMMFETMQMVQLSGQAAGLDDEFFASLEGRAERRVRAGILLGTLARQNELAVTEADIEAKFAELSEQTGKHVAKIRADFQGKQREALESRLLEQKILTWLSEHAKIHEGEPPADDDRKEASTEKTGAKKSTKKATSKKKAATKKKAPAKKAASKKAAAKKKAPAKKAASKAAAKKKAPAKKRTATKKGK